MKINKIKLTNFIGIKHGTGLDEIEIDFRSGTGNKIVMLSGGNGSGKSTVMSQLHPFKDSFDDRDTVAYDGGVKEIEIEHVSDVYTITHTYGTNAKSFIQKNGVELNENGGVRTFNQAVESEMNLTSDFFKIGKIGSNTESFIQFTTAERKEYISKFLPQIDDYIKKFELVSEKFKNLKKDLTTVSTELDKLEQEDTVKERIQILDSTISVLSTQIETTSNDVAVLNSQVESDEKINSGIDINEVINNKNEKSKRKEAIYVMAKTFQEKYDGKKEIEYCEEIIEEKIELTKKLEQEIAVMNSKNDGINNLILSAENEAKKQKYKLEGLEKTEPLEVLLGKIKDLKRDINEIENSIKSNSLTNIVSKNSDTINTQVVKFETFKNFIAKYFDDLRSSSVVPTRSNIEMFASEGFDDILRKLIDDSRAAITDKTTVLKTKNQQLSIKMANSGKIDILNQRPDACEIDTCPFIRDALKYKNLPVEIEELERQIVQLEKERTEFENKAEKIIDLKYLYDQYNSNYENMSPRNNEVYKMFLDSYGNITDAVLSNFNDFQNNTDKLISNINETIFSLNNLNKLKADLENYEYKKKYVESTETTKKEINKEISDKLEEADGYRVKLKELIDNTNLKITELNSEKEILKDYKEYLSGKKEINSLSTQISTLGTTETDYFTRSNTIKANKTNMIQLNRSLSDLKVQKEQSTKELSKANTLLSNIESLKVKKDDIEKNYELQKFIKTALDPNKGIPLYFIISYLDKTKDIANELLELAFGDNFEISFVTDPKDFYIRVRAGDNIKNDIKEASQGEISLTTISISLALIEQSLGKFNILALDEIDGPLDSSNRKNFISILNKQIEKLGIEQLFVISHNDAFDTEALDLILLKGSSINKNDADYMENKKIIFDLENL
jgi:DNA repair exonuclease SbcCD ATPase subunit